MDRRKFIIGTGIAFTTTFAGCAGNTDDPDDESSNDGGNGDDSDSEENGDEESPESDDPQSDNEPDEDDGDDEEDTSEEVDQPDPQSFSGTGATVENGIRIVGNLTVVDAKHEGESNFQVSLVDDSEYDDLFVNEIGDYEGETAALIDAGEYMLDVEADGEWEIEIRQPRAASGDALPQSLGDDKNRVFGPFEFDGTHIAEGEHHGENNFAVHVYPAEGSFGELVFNESGEYEGQTTFSHDGLGWVAVEADGDWSIDLE